MTSANILVSTIHNGDAVSHHTFDLAHLLSSQAYQVQILSDRQIGDVPTDIRPLVRAYNNANGLVPADIQILQYQAWSSLAETFRAATDPALFWYHGVTPPALWQGEDRFDILRNSQIRTELAWHAHLAVADSPFGAEELHQHSGYPMARIRVVPLGFDLTRLRNPAHQLAAAPLRTQLKLDGCRVLLYVGRISGNKRIDLLIEALSILATDKPDLRLVIVGNTHADASASLLTERLRQQVQSLGLAEKVILTGRVEAVEPYYHLADLLIHASQHEGFCAPLVEAMTFGKPVVASRSGAMPWVVGDPATQDCGGVTFDPGNTTDLARQIKHLLDDKERYLRLSSQARHRATQFDIEKFAQRAMNVINETITLAATSEKPLYPLHRDPLYANADVGLRRYQVRSGTPVIGRLIVWLRRNSTSHIKEAYLDRIIEQQVNFNRMAAAEIFQLREEIAQLRSRIERQNEE